ncbi:unnamed protein product [Peniophora sp. CBMAI 1063]|nr:unnamed protein product [Peniophora sp. CBMAI 1063]
MMDIVPTWTFDSAGQRTALTLSHLPPASEGQLQLQADLSTGTVQVCSITRTNGPLSVVARPMEAPPAYHAVVAPGTTLPTSVGYKKGHSPVCFLCHPDNEDAAIAGFVCSRYEPESQNEVDNASIAQSSKVAAFSTRPSAETAAAPEGPLRSCPMHRLIPLCAVFAGQCVWHAVTYRGPTLRRYRKRYGKGISPSTANFREAAQFLAVARVRAHKMDMMCNKFVSRTDDDEIALSNALEAEKLVKAFGEERRKLHEQAKKHGVIRESAGHI